MKSFLVGLGVGTSLGVLLAPHREKQTLEAGERLDHIPEGAQAQAQDPGIDGSAKASQSGKDNSSNGLAHKRKKKSATVKVPTRAPRPRKLTDGAVSRDTK